MTSVAGRVSLPYAGPYSTAKFATEAYMDCIRFSGFFNNSRAVLINLLAIFMALWFSFNGERVCDVCHYVLLSVNSYSFLAYFPIAKCSFFFLIRCRFLSLFSGHCSLQERALNIYIQETLSTAFMAAFNSYWSTSQTSAHFNHTESAHYTGKMYCAVQCLWLPRCSFVKSEETKYRKNTMG